MSPVVVEGAVDGVVVSVPVVVVTGGTVLSCPEPELSLGTPNCGRSEVLAGGVDGEALGVAGADAAGGVVVEVAGVEDWAKERVAQTNTAMPSMAARPKWIRGRMEILPRGRAPCKRAHLSISLDAVCAFWFTNAIVSTHPFWPYPLRGGYIPMSLIHR